MNSENASATRESNKCSQRMKKQDWWGLTKMLITEQRGKVSQIIPRFNAGASESTSQRTVQCILHPRGFSSRRLTCLTLLKSPY